MGDVSDAFVLSVDELGSFLVVPGSDAVVGHVRAGEADLPFLADVGSRHARLHRESSFRTGSTWRITPLFGEEVVVNGDEVGPDGKSVSHGDQVRLGVNLAFRFLRPEPASTTAVLELGSGAECRGCSGVVLIGEGPEGGLRIGRGSRSHLVAEGLQEDLSLELEGGVLQLRCAEGVRAGERPCGDSVRLSVPPPQRVDVYVGESVEGRPPFAIAIRPLA